MIYNYRVEIESPDKRFFVSNCEDFKITLVNNIREVKLINPNIFFKVEKDHILIITHKCFL